MWLNLDTLKNKKIVVEVIYAKLAQWKEKVGKKLIGKEIMEKAIFFLGLKNGIWFYSKRKVMEWLKNLWQGPWTMLKVKIMISKVSYKW